MPVEKRDVTGLGYECDHCDEETPAVVMFDDGMYANYYCETHEKAQAGPGSYWGKKMGATEEVGSAGASASLTDANLLDFLEAKRKKSMPDTAADRYNIRDALMEELEGS